ncbi:MAG: YgiT-type zinc finger protein [Chloroflexota bacterium]
MNNYQWKEKLVERTVTYTLEMHGQLIVIENVPARVNIETGEQLFSPNTVERLQKMVREQRKPKRVIQVPVYEFT